MSHDPINFDPIEKLRETNWQGNQPNAQPQYTNKHNWIGELAKLEKKRIALHEYIMMKLDERDYHGIADAAMDLRELDARSKAIKEWVDQGGK